MSQVLPEPLIGRVSPEMLRVHRALRALSADELVAWAGLPLPGGEPRVTGETPRRPEFLLVWKERAACLLAVSEITQFEAEQAAGESLFGLPDTGEHFANREMQCVSDFLDNVSPDRAAGVCGAVIFPNVDSATLEKIGSPDEASPLHFFGREALADESIPAFMEAAAGVGAAEHALAELRARFTPESVIPQHFTSRGRMHRNVEASLTPLLLDVDQDRWAKQRLYLPEESGRVAETLPVEGGASLVTGVAGSGKSLVLLFRACTQAKLDPFSRALVLTHNKALRMELESRFGDLGRPRNVKWQTFFGSIWSLSPGGEPIQYGEREEWVRKAAEPVFGSNTLNINRLKFLCEEFDWMQDNDLADETAYMGAPRTGRGTRLESSIREKVFEVFKNYRASLAVAGRNDWSGYALDFWHQVKRGERVLPKFDYLYVDEAQFFAPVWFYILRHAVMEPHGRILLAADPTQGFLKRRQSWSALGMDMRGRSTRLKRAYRNSREILEFAAAFYRSRMQEEELEDLNLPGDEEMAFAPKGSNPDILPLGSAQDEITRLINELKKHLHHGGDPGAVLVLDASPRGGGHALRQALGRAFGEARVCDAKENASRSAIRVVGLEAATGLEAPVVFVVGAASLLEREEDLELRPEQREELVRDNTRRLYMAFTRAGMRLVLTWVGKLPGWAGTGER